MWTLCCRRLGVRLPVLLLLALAGCGREQEASRTAPQAAADRAEAAQPATGDGRRETSGATERGLAGPFGAIAVSGNGLYAGISDGEASRARAEAAAVRTCRNSAKGKATDCESKLWFRDACGAIAMGDDGAYGTGWGDTPKLACGWAVRSCRDAGGKGCEGNFYQCSPRKLSGTCDGRLRSYQ